MNEKFEKLEADLAAMRPVPLSPDLADRIAAKLEMSPSSRLDVVPSPRMSLADRCLATFMGAGALAACVIVGLLTWRTLEPVASSSPQPILAVQSSGQSSGQTLGQYQQLLARAGDPFDGFLK